MIQMWWLVILALAFSLCGANLLLALLEQHRWSITSKPALLSTHAFRISIGVCYGGVVGCGACFCLVSTTLYDENATYDTIILLAAFALSVIAYTSCIYIVSSDCIFTKDKEQLFGMLLREMSQYRLSTIRNPNMILLHALTTNSRAVLVSGLISGVCSAAMIYAIIYATHTHAVSLIVGYVIPVCLLSVAVHITMFIALFRILTLFPNRIYVRIAVTLLIPASYFVCCFAALASIAAHENVQTAKHHVSNKHVIPVVAVILGAAFLIINRIAYYDMRYRLLEYMKPSAHSSSDADDSSGDESVLMAVVRSMRANSPIKSAKKVPNPRIHPQRSHSSLTVATPFAGGSSSVATVSCDGSAVFILQDMV